MSSCESSHAETTLERPCPAEAPSPWRRLLWPVRMLEAALVAVCLLLIGAYRLFISPLSSRIRTSPSSRTMSRYSALTSTA